jgi:hypothetical protein
MISLDNPRSLIIVGFILVLFGAVAPFLMVIGVLESTFFLNFFSFAASVVGLFLGLLGISMYRKTTRK